MDPYGNPARHEWSPADPCESDQTEIASDPAINIMKQATRKTAFLEIDFWKTVIGIRSLKL